jgi:hypothetical protein
MKRVEKLLSIYLFASFFLTFQSFSQEVSITGLVVNSNQEPVSNVQVLLAGSPENYCYTNQSGEFYLTDMATSLPEQAEQTDYMNILENGSIEMEAFNKSFKMTIVDLLGRIVCTGIDEDNLNGNYIVFPEAYIQDQPAGIYIATATLGDKTKSFKICNFNRTGISHGFIETGYTEPEKQSVTKHTLNSEDTLIFIHDFYKTTKLPVIEQKLDVGTIQLENFSSYSPAQGVVPDKITYDNHYGSFIKVLGQDSSIFILNIDAYSTWEKEIKFKAIPVKEFDFLDSSFKYISGIHLEPSGINFYFPIPVNVELNRVENTDSLVVILHNNQTGKVSYLPFLKDEPYLKNINIGFFITCFTDIIVAKGKIPRLKSTSFSDSDDAISYIASLIGLGFNVTDDLFVRWYNDVVKHEITAIMDMETLKFAVHDLVLIEQYGIYAQKMISEFSFYDEAMTNLSEKIKYLFEMAKEECNVLKDTCLRRDLVLIAVQLNNIAQRFQDIKQVDISEMCDGEAANIVNKIILAPQYVGIKPGETAQVTYYTENIYNLTIAKNPPLDWFSENPEIAQVDTSGLISGIKEGKTKIIAKSCDIIESIPVVISQTSSSYCNNKENQFTGTYYTRLLLHGYHNDEYARITYNKYQTIELTMIFSEDGEDIYYGGVNEEWHTIERRWVGGRYVIETRYSNSSHDLQWDEHGHINCCLYGYYKTFGHDMELNIYIFPEKRKVIADEPFFKEKIFGTGTF